MTTIDVFSGFLGAGKTTLIKKLIAQAYKNEKIVLIENEFGEIGIDGGFLKDSGIQINEMNSGCICCSLVGDFGKALQDVVAQFNPDRILIEPSGVGKLSDVIGAIKNVMQPETMKLGGLVSVCDANKYKMYMTNFGEFYENQIESANTIILSRTQSATDKKIADCVSAIRAKNPTANIITTPWDDIDGAIILEAMNKDSLKNDDLLAQEEEHEHDEHCCCGHHHDEDEEHEHHHEHGEHCCCGHHHDEDEEDEHHHEHGEHCCCGHHHDEDEEHEHHHEHGEHCCCGHHHDEDEEHEHHHEHGEHCCGHHHHHDHDADEVFTSFGGETPRKFTEEEIQNALKELDNSEKYGLVLRAKGIVASTDGEWIHFDYVPEEINIRRGSADYTGRLCVIGSKMNEQSIKQLFHLI